MPVIHIVELLEEKPFNSLNAAEISHAESHIAACRECKPAYEAARIAAVMIEVRVAETVEVGPFFNTRVMAAIREKRLSAEEPALVRMWRAASALVSTMGILLVILTGFTIFSNTPDSRTPAAIAATQSIYSPEYVVIDRGDLDEDEVANDQVVGTIYDLEDGDDQ